MGGRVRIFLFWWTFSSSTWGEYSKWRTMCSDRRKRISHDNLEKLDNCRQRKKTFWESCLLRWAFNEKVTTLQMQNNWLVFSTPGESGGKSIWSAIGKAEAARWAQTQLRDWGSMPHETIQQLAKDSWNKNSKYQEKTKAGNPSMDIIVKTEYLVLRHWIKMQNRRCFHRKLCYSCDMIIIMFSNSHSGL